MNFRGDLRLVSEGHLIIQRRLSLTGLTFTLVTLVSEEVENLDRNFIIEPSLREVKIG